MNNYANFESKIKISVVIPCFNSQDTIIDVVELTIKEFSKMGLERYEFILVNDCSKDETWEKIKELSKKYFFVKALNLSKNFGQHNAIMAGLNYTEGDLTLCMDDDLQTHPSQIKRLIEKINEGWDVVIASYPTKKHNLFRVLGSKLNRITLLMIGSQKDIQFQSFFIMRKFILERIVKYQNPYAHLQGLILRTTNHIANVEVDHYSRKVGKSNYSFKKLVSLWVSFTNFSVLPLRVVFFMGLLFSLMGFVGALYIIVKKIIQPTFAIGWASIMFSIFVFSGIILISIGVLGEYIGRVFISINDSPQYVVREEINTSNKVNE
jgi:glycosyltransferase involved in cell wall biosynthesis